MKFFYKALIFLMLMLVLYTPHILVFGYVIKGIYFVFVGAILWILTNFKIEVFVLHMMVIVTFVFSATFFSNFYLSSELLRQAIIFFALAVFLSALYKLSRRVLCHKGFVKVLCAVILVQSLAVLLSATIPNFAQEFHQIFVLTARGSRYIGEDVLINRYSGFAPSGFSILSVYTAMLLVLLDRERNVMNSAWLLNFTIGVGLASLIFIGRLGLYIALAYFCARFLISKPLRSLGLLSLVMVLFIISPYGVAFFENLPAIFFAFELFFEGSSQTTTTLVNSEYFFPQVSLFGDGRLLRSEGGVDSDVGFVKMLSAVGYFGVVTFYTCFIALLIFGATGKKSQIGATSILLLSCIYLIGNLKDLYFLSSGYTQALLLALLFEKARGNSVNG